MRYRRFGSTGLQVSEIGFGCSRLGGVFAQGNSRQENLRALRGALDAGINFFDTADMYAQGEAEALLGEAFRGRREQVILATKGGYCLPAQRRWVARVKPLVRPIIRALGLRRERLPAGVSGALSQDFSPGYLRAAVEGSLRRLRTDCIDLYQLHSPPASVIQSGEFVDVMEELRQQGKIRFWGIAADTAQDAALALQYPQVASLQVPFGLLDLEALDLLLRRVGPGGPAVIVRGCFGGGLLKEDLTAEQLQATTGKWERILYYRRFAQQRGRPILEMALQFVLRAPGVSVALLGMRTEAHLVDNLRYYAAPALSAEEFAQLEGAQVAVR